MCAWSAGLICIITAVKCDSTWQVRETQLTELTRLCLISQTSSLAVNSTWWFQHRALASVNVTFMWFPRTPLTANYHDLLLSLWSDFHETWWKDSVRIKEELITFWCWSLSGGRSRIAPPYTYLKMWNGAFWKTVLQFSGGIILGSRWKNIRHI